MTLSPFALRIVLAVALVAAVRGPLFAAPHAGDEAPEFSVAKATGGAIDLRRFRGKPVYVNFFASWCGPCNAEAPDIARISRTYRSRGLTVVGIDELETASKAQAFAKNFRWPFLVGTDDDGTVGRAYGALGLPVHVFVDKRGYVSTYRLGEMDPAEIEDAIKKIL